MENVKAQSFLSFHFNFMMLMLQCGRVDEAIETAHKVARVIDALPDDLFVDVELEPEHA